MHHIRFTLAIALLLAVSSSPLRSDAGPRRAPFAVGGPDASGYQFIDSQEQGGPVFSSVWEDISSSGTLIFGAQVDDSVSGAVSIPFQFPFYGSNYGACYVSSNGNLHFGSPSATYPGTTIPSAGAPNALIAGFWADCHTGPDGHIRWAGDANRFIVQWTSCEYYPSNNAETFTYQIKLLPSGTIYIAYETMTNNGASNSTAIGIENASGNVGLQYCFNGSPNTVASQRVIQFGNNQPPAAPVSLEQANAPGGTAIGAGSVTNGTLFFRGTLTDPNAGNTIGMQVEVLPASAPFQPTVTGTSVQTPVNAMVTNNNVSELSIAGLAEGSWHWRARAYDNNNAFSNWVTFTSGTPSFYIDVTPPTVPGGPLSPTGQSYTTATGSQPITMSWGSSFDSGPPFPVSYIVEVAFDPTFATVADTITTSGTTHFTNFGSSSREYFWRVSAVDEAGNQSGFAGPASFKVSMEEPEEPEEDILPCAAGVATAGWTPLVGLLLAGALLVRRRLRR